MRSPLAALLSLLLLLPAAPLSAAQAPTEPATEPWLLAALETRLSRLTSDQLVISPDGSRLAYTFREGADLFLLVAACAEPGKVLAKVRIGTEDSSQHIPKPMKMEGGGFMTPKVPQPIAYKGKTAPLAQRLLWAGNRHLVVVTNLNVPTLSRGLNYNNRHGGLFVVQAEGETGRLLTTSTEISRRFDGSTHFSDLVLEDDTHGLVRLNDEKALRIGLLDGSLKQVPLGLHTRAIEASKAARKQLEQLARPHLDRLEREFPEYRIDLLGADLSGRVIALRKHNPIDAGSLCFLLTDQQRLFDLARCQPETLPADFLLEQRSFEDETGISHERVQLRRRVPLPGRGGLLVVCRDTPAQPVPRHYDPRLMCLVEMGYTVLQLGRLQFPDKATPAELQREMLRLLPTAGRVDMRGHPSPPSPKALLGLGGQGNELAYLALYHQEEEWDAGIFLRPSLSGKDLLDRAEALLGKEWGKSEKGRPRPNRQALCLYADGTNSLERERALLKHQFSFEPLERKGTLVSYAPETWAARVLQHDEELVPLYEGIDRFLRGAFVKTRIELGKPEVVQMPAKD